MTSERMSLCARALLASLAAALCGCAAVGPEAPLTVGEVHVRTGADPKPQKPLGDDEAKQYAEAVLPFARVARRAYCDYLRESGAQPEACDKASPMVEDDGWHLLFDSRAVLPPEDQHTRLTFLAFDRVHLGDPTQGDIVFGFRGTKLTYASDWNANLRWLTRHLPGADQYDVLYANAPALIERAKREAAAQAPTVVRFDIYATGHSLGGGLAQLFAFSDRSVRAAIVFDPSPVTGYFTTVSDERVNCEARILRVYERGEVLQYLRAMLRRFYSPSENIAEVDFNMLHGGFDPIANHSIATFTDKLGKAVDALNARTASAPRDRRERRLALETPLPKEADHFCIETRRAGR